MKWEIYNYLKNNNGQVNDDFTDIFMYTSPFEIQEGIYEYEIMQEKNAEFYNPINWGVTHE